MVSLVFCGLLAYLAFQWINARRAGRRSSALAVVAKWAVALAAVVVTVMVTLSRLYLGVHWASDLLAGWFLGGAWLVLTPALVTAVRRAGGPHSLLGDSGALGRSSVRIVLSIALVLIVAAAALLTAWANPLAA